MSPRSFAVDPAIATYAESMSMAEAPILAQLREETAALPESRMQIGPEQGHLMGTLAKLIGARSYLEIGVFTGYSSLAVALALPDDGRIVACDVSEEFTSIARRFWEMAGVAHKIDLRLAPALETLEELSAEGRRFDLAFIDADKPSMPAYFNACVELVRTGGLILIDNVLWSGRVLNSADEDEETQAIHRCNEIVRDDRRVDVLMLPLGDGITLARKR